MKVVCKLIMVVWSGLISLIPCGAQELERAFGLDAIDLKYTCSFRNGKARPVSTAVLRYVLGYSDHWAPWQAGKYEKGVRYHFRLAFKKPVYIGSVLGGLGRLSYLKPGAPYPGDPANPKHWIAVQGSGFTTLPPKVKTRAVLAAGKSYWDQTLRCWQ